jgi:hypothetical protein
VRSTRQKSTTIRANKGHQDLMLRRNRAFLQRLVWSAVLFPARFCFKRSGSRKFKDRFEAAVLGSVKRQAPMIGGGEIAYD